MAEPTFVGSTLVNPTTPVTSDSFAYDVGSGSNRTLVVGLFIYDTNSSTTQASTVTYNSVALTARVVTIYTFAGRSITSELWTLDDPASGSNTLAVTWNEEVSNIAAIIPAHYTGANNGVGTGTASVGANTSDHEYDNAGDDADGIHIQVGGRTNSASTYSEGTGTSLIEGGADDSTYGWMASEGSTGGTDTVGGTLSATIRSSSVIMELLPSGGAPPTDVVQDIIGGGIIAFER